jgi:hypothetical protein
MWILTQNNIIWEEIQVTENFYYRIVTVDLNFPIYVPITVLCRLTNAKCSAFVGLNNKLYIMHGTYTKQTLQCHCIVTYVLD